MIHWFPTELERWGMVARAGVGLMLACFTAVGVPPYWGTIFIDPDIITPADPTTFTSIVSTGRGNRQMFDRRVDNWVVLNAYLFSASYNDGLRIEMQVNPEFGSTTNALAEARKYAEVIGRLPTSLRLRVQTSWIHLGLQPFGGGNNNLLIHTGQADDYVSQGILEETLVHEAAHSSLDEPHATATRWLAAQTADGEFISNYARDYPDREDIAESFLPYLALRMRPERISTEDAETIARTMPNRIAYFNNLALAMHPIVLIRPPVFKGIIHDRANARVTLKWSSRAGASYQVQVSTNLVDWEELAGTVASAGVETSTTVAAGAAQQWFRVREL